jgi:predicted small lipoprotein YifL
MHTRQTSLLLICLLLASCGQTGPLYLPETETAPEAAPEAASGSDTAPGLEPDANPAADD